MEVLSSSLHVVGPLMMSCIRDTVTNNEADVKSPPPVILTASRHQSFRCPVYFKSPSVIFFTSQSHKRKCGICRPLQCFSHNSRTTGWNQRLRTSDLNCDATGRVLTATSTVVMLAADRSWAGVPRKATSDMSVLSCRPFCRNQTWTAAEVWVSLSIAGVAFGAVHVDEELCVVGELVVWHAVWLDQLTNHWHVGSEQQQAKHWTLRYATVTLSHRRWVSTKTHELLTVAEIRP